MAEPAATEEAPLRVLIVNIVALNTGDAAILHGTIDALRETFGDRLDVTVADQNPDAARRLYPEIRFVPGLHADRPTRAPRGLRSAAGSLRRRRTALAVRLLRYAPQLARRLLDAEGRAHLDRIRAADVVISSGGTYFVEHYAMRWHADELIAARALGTPTYLYTQSLGPFRTRRNRRRMRRVLGDAEHIFVRGERSRRHVLELGISERSISTAPDAAFALSSGPRPGSRRDGPLRVAVSVRPWRHFRTRDPGDGLDAYRRAVADVVRSLARDGAEVTFLSTCQGIPEYWADDAEFARALVDEHVPDVSGIAVDGAFRRPRVLVSHLRSFDLAIATRLHFAILALAAGVPVVPIAYEFKTMELFADLGMGDLVDDIETVTGESLRRRVDRALDSLEPLRGRIADALPALRRETRTPSRVLRRRVDRTAASRPAHTGRSAATHAPDANAPRRPTGA